MAELLIKIGEGANYQDGDCICAFNRRMILFAHSQEICHVKKAARNSSGLIVADDPLFDWYEKTHQYKFQRVSPTEIQRIAIATGDTEKVDLTPDENGDVFDVRLFIATRKRSPRHCLFGEDGAEFFYDGRKDFSESAMDEVWNAIEAKTPHRRNRPIRRLWPMGRLDIRSHLAIRTVELTDQDVADFTEPEYETDDNGRFIWERSKADGAKEEITGTESMTEKPEGQRWKLKRGRQRRRNMDWEQILGDLSETRERIRDTTIPIGEEIDDNGRHRYTSKQQRLQQKTQVRKKPRNQRLRGR